MLQFLSLSKESKTIVKIEAAIIASGVYLILFTILYILADSNNFSDDNNQLLRLIRLNFEEVIETLIGFLIWDVFRNVTPLQNTDKAYLIKKIFMMVGYSFFILSLVRLLSVFVLLITYLFSFDFYLQTSETLFLIGLDILGVGVFIFGLVWFFLAFWSPEAFIISNKQINGVIRLYDLLDNIKQKDKSDISLSNIENYLFEVGDLISKNEEDNN